MTGRRMKAVLLAAALASVAAAAAPDAPTAEVATGRLRGVTKDGVAAFLGIPYAAPPVGPLRWRSPQPAARWSGTRDATAFGPSCPQVLNPPEGRAPWTPEYLIPGPTSEDCLTLNVWRPADPKLRGAPVLLWLHGGGEVEGSASVPVYDGAAFARQGIVVVAINYRLSVLSLFALDELSREDGAGSGNYAVRDVVAALRWVKANVAAFGGDPARVTLAGQSAGSGLVTQMIASPMAKGLFARAITESGSQWGTRPGPLPLAAGEARGRRFAESLGAHSLADLRAMPADELVRKAAAGGRIGAVLDGRYVVSDAGRRQTTPGFNDTPILSGFNWDEESGMDPRYGQWTAAELATKRDALFAPFAAQAAALYPAATDAEAREVGQDMAREHSRALVYEWARRRAPATRQPIYIYLFHHPEPGPTQARYGTFHSSEIPYVFGNLDAPRPFTAADRAVSRRMQARWVGFIRGGAPDVVGSAPWPAFDAADPRIMLLGDREGVEPVLPPAKLALSDRMAEQPLTK